MKQKLFLALTGAMTLAGSFSVFADGDTAKAADATAAPAGGLGSSWWIWILIYGLMFAAFYFLLIRPNKKKQKKEEELRNSIALNDEITTIGGICGRVVSVKDDDITIETSIDRTLVQFKKWAVRDVKKMETEDVKAEEKKD